MIHTTRRSLLSAGLALAAMQAFPKSVLAQTVPTRLPFEPKAGAWRTFEISTTVTLPDGKGPAQVWLPIPDLDNDYQRGLGNEWTGNAVNAGLVSDQQAGVRMLRAEFAPAQAGRTVTLVNRVQTRNRIVDWSSRGSAKEDPAILKANLQGTELQPVDGIVCDKALEITKGAQSDVDKVRALYDWVVVNAYREPKTRGCGTGDVVAMLKSGNLGGKCADLSALFATMARSIGIPAREVYGLRVVPSAFGYRELGGNSANLTGAQHCRAEVWLEQYGWVAMDPADVLKVMRQETPDWIKDARDPLVAPVNKALFGNWEGNWVGWNSAHDIRLPGATSASTLPFLMYPQGQDESGRFDELAPDAFRYAISAKEVAI